MDRLSLILDYGHSLDGGWLWMDGVRWAFAFNIISILVASSLVQYGGRVTPSTQTLLSSW